RRQLTRHLERRACRPQRCRSQPVSRRQSFDRGSSFADYGGQVTKMTQNHVVACVSRAENRTKTDLRPLTADLNRGLPATAGRRRIVLEMEGHAPPARPEF